MNQIENNIRYILYVRKSTDDVDRQLLSLESQTNELTKLAKKLNIKIVKTISESRSAKDIGRPGFNEAIEMISSNQADGILCWKLDRLSRNPKDSGELMDLLQKGKIKIIRTIDSQYLPTDNTLIAIIELGMANQYIRDLGFNVKRGLRTKAEKGWYPGIAKPGYLNDKYCEQGEHKLLKDPDGFHLIKLAFEKLLTGLYRPSQVLTMLNNDWGYKTPVRRKTGGKPMSVSVFYKMLSDPFYYGEFEYPVGSGNWYRGAHEPMISENDFNIIQSILNTKGGSRPRITNKADRALYGVFKCADCGSIITPDIQEQIICSGCKNKFSSKHTSTCPKCGLTIEEMKNPSHLKYVYYGCPHSKNRHCNQKSIESKELDRQVVEVLESIKISEQMKDWYIEQINNANNQEQFSQTAILKSLQKRQSNLKKSMDNLLTLRISPDNANGELISNEEFSFRRAEINKELHNIQEQLAKSDQSTNEWTDLAIDIFDFACYAKHNYENGNLQDKKAILLGFGSNLLIKDRKIIVSLPKHLELVRKANSKISELGIKFEPGIFGSDNKKTDSLEPVFSLMLGDRDSNSDKQDQNLLSYH